MTQSHPNPETVEQRHEGSSIRSRQVMVAVLGLVVLIVASLLIVAGVNSFLAGADHARVVPSRDVAAPARGTPLKPDQGEQKREYLAEQQQLLNSYGWVNREQGIARIPIEDAMRIYIEQDEVAE